MGVTDGFALVTEVERGSVASVFHMINKGTNPNATYIGVYPLVLSVELVRTHTKLTHPAYRTSALHASS